MLLCSARSAVQELSLSTAENTRPFSLIPFMLKMKFIAKVSACLSHPRGRLPRRVCSRFVSAKLPRLQFLLLFYSCFRGAGFGLALVYVVWNNAIDCV